MSIFECFALRFQFQGKDSIRFTPGQSGNLLRGAFGSILHQLPGDAYARIFRPEGVDGGPSGLKDRPRPFVFRAAHLDGRTIAPGERFYFDVHLFYAENPPIRLFEQALAQLARAELVNVTVTPVNVPLEPHPAPVGRVLVRFLTPTELKSGDEIAARPEFATLFARIRDRVSTLRALYGRGPLEIDFRGMGERAAVVRMTRCELRHSAVERRSTRTGQTHPLGGFTGEAEYEGELAGFLPFLEAARWTGIGRQTVWGKGAIETAVLC